MTPVEDSAIWCPPWCGQTEADHRREVDRGESVVLHAHWELVQTSDQAALARHEWPHGDQVDLAQETGLDGRPNGSAPYMVIDDEAFTADDVRRLIAELQRKLAIVEGASC